MIAIEESLERARELSAQNHEEQAQALLLDVLREHPDCNAALFMLAGSYFCTEKYLEAIVLFEQLVLVFPGSGKASAGLYNARWNSGQPVQALEEIKRFLKVADREAEKDTVSAYLRIAETLSANHDDVPH